MKSKITCDYDKKYDIFYANWGSKCKHSLEVLNGQIVLDFDNKGNIIGIEIFDLSQIIKEGMIKNNKMFDKLNKLAKIRRKK